MPNATEMATKTMIMLVERLWAVRAFISWALVSIQLSALSEVSRPTCSAIASAAKMSATVRSMTVTPPGRSSSDWACLRSRYT